MLLGWLLVFAPAIVASSLDGGLRQEFAAPGNRDIQGSALFLSPDPQTDVIQVHTWFNFPNIWAPLSITSSDLVLAPFVALTDGGSLRAGCSHPQANGDPSITGTPPILPPKSVTCWWEWGDGKEFFDDLQASPGQTIALATVRVNDGQWELTLTNTNTNQIVRKTMTAPAASTSVPAHQAILGLVVFDGSFNVLPMSAIRFSPVEFSGCSVTTTGGTEDLSHAIAVPATESGKPVADMHITSSSDFVVTQL